MDRLLLMAAGAGLFVAGLLTNKAEPDKPGPDGNAKNVPTLEPKLVKNDENRQNPILDDSTSDDNSGGNSTPTQEA